MKTRRHEGELSPPLEVPRRRSVVTSPPSIAIAPGQVETMLGTEEAISIDDPPMPAPEAAPGAAPQGKNTAAKKQKIDYTGRSVYIKHVDVSPTDETDSVNVVWTGVLYRYGAPCGAGPNLSCRSHPPSPRIVFAGKASTSTCTRLTGTRTARRRPSRPGCAIHKHSLSLPSYRSAYHTHSHRSPSMPRPTRRPR